MISQQAGSHVSAPPHATLSDRLAHWVVTGDRGHLPELLDEVANHLDISITTPAHATNCTH